MAGGVPNREEDRLVLLARALERFLSPGVPVDGIPRMHIQRRRALLTLAAGIGMPAALRLALAQSSARQGVHTVQGDMRINGRPAETGTVVRPGDAIVLANGALTTFVVGQDAFLMRGGSHAELIGSGVLVSALQLVTGKLLAVFGSGGERRLVNATATT